MITCFTCLLTCLLEGVPRLSGLAFVVFLAFGMFAFTNVGRCFARYAFAWLLLSLMHGDREVQIDIDWFAFDAPR